MKILTVPLTLLLTVPTSWAFQSRPTLDCNNDHGNSDRGHFCEMREQTVSAAGMISVDGSQNGGISVKGWDRSDVLVRAQVRGEAPTDDQAKDVVRQVIVSTGGQVRATGPAHDRDRSWSVSYEIFVPTRFSVNLATVNGGLSISDVNGNLEFKTVNGGLNLRRVGGYVHGQTTNGGVNVELAGDRWDGQGLDVATTNGGVNLRIPRNYSAQFETETHNGRIRAVDMPEVQTQSPTGHAATHVSTALGAGGAMLKITTTNGGVNLSRI
ncbi:MAG TPA: hypothetical protein VGL72_05410 [Bryobacteraceae bacterium]|jgi:hypothetical protein